MILDFLDHLYDFIDRQAKWSVAALLVVILLLAQQAFTGRRTAIGVQVELLDGRRWYTPLQVAQLFEELGPGRGLYAITELTVDVIYPLAYGLLFAILLVRTWGPRYPWMLAFPLLTVTFDLLENVFITYLLFSFGGQPSWVAWLAASCTLAKSIFFLISIVLVLNGGIVRQFRP